MATSSHTIYSHYSPEDREALERETGQIPSSSEDNAQLWDAEAASVYKAQMAPAPRFVPATLQTDEWGQWLIDTAGVDSAEEGRDSSVADWYRSLSRTLKSSTPSLLPSTVNRAPAPARKAGKEEQKQLVHSECSQVGTLFFLFFHLFPR